MLVGLGLLVAAYAVQLVTLPGSAGAFVPFIAYLLVCIAWGASAR